MVVSRVARGFSSSNIDDQLTYRGDQRLCLLNVIIDCFSLHSCVLAKIIDRSRKTLNRRVELYFNYLVGRLHAANFGNNAFQRFGGSGGTLRDFIRAVG